jgi:hypothetical protein
MVSHCVVMKPRPSLTAAEQDALIAAFERAIREIPTVRRVRVGRRIVHGAHYEARMPDAADYLVLIDFADLAGLTTYLHHPAHDDIRTHFGQAVSAAFIYDFEEVTLESLKGTRTPAAPGGGAQKS